MNDYINFEEACAMLNTPSSTLYRWLRAGKIPGHKLGRQWRFLRAELEAFIHASDSTSSGLESLAQLLQDRALARRGLELTSHDLGALGEVSELAESLIWDAVDSEASVIHLSPKAGSYQLKYRSARGLTQIHELTPSDVEQLDQRLTSISHPIRREGKRRLYLEREVDAGAERLHVRYQKIDTFTGERLTLRLVKESRIASDLDIIAPRPDDVATLRRWSHAPRGITLISGRSGSGKTTTAYCALQEIAQREDRVIFTIEDTIDVLLDGVNQVSVDLDDEGAYRRAFVDIFDSDIDVLFISSSFAQRHLSTLWGSALSAAEAGCLVLVQLEADSASDARDKFAQAVDRSMDEHLLGVVWQELKTDPESGQRSASYDFMSGALDVSAD